MILKRGLVALCFCLGVAAYADSSPEATFDPPEPRSDEFDWIQFNNGEWLKGEIVDLQDGKFEFESDELDKFSLDLDDIHVIHSSRRNTVGLQDRRSLQGTIDIIGDTVRITTPEGVEEFPRSEMRSIVPGDLTESVFWTFRLSLGASGRSGNVDQTDASLFFNATRRTIGTRSLFDYIGNFGWLNGVETSNNHRTNVSHDIYLSGSFFLRAFSMEVYLDPIQNIDYRLTPAIGLGYDLVDTSSFEWKINLSAGYQYTRFLSVQEGADISEGSASISFGTVFDWALTARTDIVFRYNVVVPTGDYQSYTSSTLFRAEFELTRSIDFELTLGWDHVNLPRADENGFVPEQDDFRATIGLGADF